MEAAFGTMLGIVLLSVFLEEQFELLGHSCCEYHVRDGPALVCACRQAGPRCFRREAKKKTCEGQR